MALTSGTYTAKVERKVVVWPAPSVDGDGEYVWETELIEGVAVGRRQVRDANGKPVAYFKPPEGFRNVPSYDHTDNYVLFDDRGTLVRQPNGESVSIKPGHALVFEPDGSVTTLQGEYAQYVFSKHHDATNSTVEE